MGEAKNIAGEWGVDKSHGGEQKIRGGGLSRGVLLRGVQLTIFCYKQYFYKIGGYPVQHACYGWRWKIMLEQL